MKSKLTALFLLFFVLNVFSLAFNLNQNSYSKGDLLTSFGTCRSDVSITVLSSGKSIFSETASCTDGEYSFEREIVFSDPSGLWTVTAVDSDSNINKTFLVENSRESKFLLLKFLSPSANSKNKGETVTISIKATDSGQNVETASLYYWSP